MEPAVGYGLSWALWLSQVPYGVWSEHIAEPSMHEFRHSAERLEAGGVRPALAHFALAMRAPWTTLDLAAAMNSLVEGLWLNQCLSRASDTPERPDRGRGTDRDSHALGGSDRTRPVVIRGARRGTLRS